MTEQLADAGTAAATLPLPPGELFVGGHPERVQHCAVSRPRTGTVWVNTYYLHDLALPFGAFKASGWGREMGQDVLENYKGVCMVPLMV